MKRKDLTLIFVVVFVSAVFSLIISSIFITAPKNRQEKVEVVGKITTEFPDANKKFFNENSINPTVLICIGSNNDCTAQQSAE